MHGGDLLRVATTACLDRKTMLSAAEGSSLLSRSHLMIRWPAYLSELTKKTLMTSRPLHTSKDSAGGRSFSGFNAQELTCLKRMESRMSLCWHPLCPLYAFRNSWDNMQISAFVEQSHYCWVQISSRKSCEKITSLGSYGCSFIHKSMVFGLPPFTVTSSNYCNQCSLIQRV